MAALAAVGVPVQRTAPAVVASPSLPAMPAAEMGAPAAQDTGYGRAQAPLVQARPPRRRWPWALVLAVLLAAGAGAAAYLLTRPLKEVVPTVVGEQLTVAQAQIQNAGLAVSVVDVTDAKPAGTVIRQDPLGGAKAKEGSTVALTVSQGPGNATVPPVFGFSRREAQAAIGQAALKWRVQTESSQTLPAGEAIGTVPASGQSVPVGARVVLLISSGKPLVTIPNVTDVAQSRAELDLANAGLTVGSVTTQPSTTIPPGNVITLSPSPYAQVPPGSTVNLVIASKPTSSTSSSTSSSSTSSSSSTTTSKAAGTVPRAKGHTEAQAMAALGKAGYQVVVQAKDTTRREQDGVVLSETPRGGTPAAVGSTVTIVVGRYRRSATTSTTGTATTSAISSTSTSTTSTSTT